MLTTIDLGSNSFRVLNYDCLNHKIIDEYQEVVSMADGLVDTGNISQAAQERVINAILKSSQKLNYDPSTAVCVTTAAMRMANNSQEVLDYFKEKTGTNFRIIDGVEEARLTLLAIKYALKREKIDSEKFILLDIGGGSTEIIVNHGLDYDSHSFNFGIVTLTQKNFNEKELKEYLALKKLEIKNFLLTLELNLDEYTFVSTAGTPTTIAAFKLGLDFFHYDKDIVNGTKVNLNDIADSLDTFKTSSVEEIARLVGPGRTDFIEVGILIFEAIFEVLNKEESIVFDDGLREGVAINQCLLK